MSGKFDSKSLDEIADGLNVECCAGGKWGLCLGILPMTRETFRLDNLESEVVGGAGGAEDRDGSNKQFI